MTIYQALDKAEPTTTGDRFAIAQPFPDVTFIAAYWASDDAIRVRGHRFENAGRHRIIEQWDVEAPAYMTVSFEPLCYRKGK